MPSNPDSGCGDDSGSANLRAGLQNLHTTEMPPIGITCYHCTQVQAQFDTHNEKVGSVHITRVLHLVHINWKGSNNVYSQICDSCGTIFLPFWIKDTFDNGRGSSLVLQGYPNHNHLPAVNPPHWLVIRTKL